MQRYPGGVTETDLSTRNDKDLADMAERIWAYRRLVRDCPHIDGWRSFELIGSNWQCQSCGLVVRPQDRAKAERWPEGRVPDGAYVPPPAPGALGEALAFWESPGAPRS